MSTGLKANSDGSAAIQVGGTDVITLTSGGAATFVTSPTTVQAGTAAAPSITTSGDTNTGIFFPAADTVGLTAGGTQVGSVGLGTTLALQGATSQSGTGITFPATQSASSNANTLDDYEEGTWTPTVAGGSGTAYNTQQGWYTKVGNLVTVGFEIELNTKGTITGGAAIAGLPFTSGSAPVRTSGALSVAASTGSYVSQGLFVDASSTQISIYTKTAASTAASQPTGTAFYTATTQIIGGVSYHV